MQTACMYTRGRVPFDAFHLLFSVERIRLDPRASKWVGSPGASPDGNRLAMTVQLCYGHVSAGLLSIEKKTILPT